MKVVYDKDPEARLGNKPPVRFAETLEELLSSSDIVTIHVPLTGETRGLIGERELASARTMREASLKISALPTLSKARAAAR
ncbi:MAG: NAD(P)-dependent oxidoreductase [Thermoproteota archaeon]